MHSGSGYRYLLKTVATGDGDRDLSQPLTKYYVEKGTPPGRWLGSGLHSLNDPTLIIDAPVTEQQLQLLIGYGLHPTTAEKLGRAFGNYRKTAQRIHERITELDATLGDDARTEAISCIEAEEQQAGTRRATAGWDFTIAVPKSVSTLWALADAGTQAMITQAHHDAVAQVIDMLERNLVWTRTGKGGSVHAEVTGVVAAAFDHYDSRAGDPHLHTHVVVSNKVMRTGAGGWYALDGTPLHNATVALSELHNAILADLLTRRFGVQWRPRNQGRDHNPSWEISGVPEELLREFSSRSCDIDDETDRLIASYAERYGRQPSKKTIIRLRQLATLTTRPEKVVRSLADLTGRWRDQAATILQRDPQTWATELLADENTEPLLRADDIPPKAITQAAHQTLIAVGNRRTTWRYWNLHAEASRQTKGWRFATPADRETITAQIAEAAQAASVKLTPTALVAPAALTRADGTSLFRPKNQALFTSQAMLDAEERLLSLATDTTGPTLDLNTIQQIASQPDETGLTLGLDQQDALERIAVSGIKVDVLVGPAGAGKTTAMRALKQAWEQQNGPGSVVGLAPSATAAQVLGNDLGIATENTAKWLVDHDKNGRGFRAGQLVIIDEASLAGTFTLDRICALATQAGAKVLLVGDWAQLQAVEAGGAFNLIVTSRNDTPELSDIHRFTHQWEKTASLELRFGNPDVISTYTQHGRIHDGDTDTMRQAAYAAWKADTNAGLQSVLIADDRATVTELNRQARHDRIIAGLVDPTTELNLTEGTRASLGDLIITRRNDRRIVAGSTGWVRNGDRWTITHINPDGSAIVRRAGYTRGASTILPAPYVKEAVDLGYAATAHRSQGITVDTSHTVVSSKTPRENLYVAMTRGRQTNTAYVTIDHATEDTQHLGKGRTTAAEVLTQVLRTNGAEPSAHQAKQAEEHRWLGIGQLLTECQQLITEARREWEALPIPDKAKRMHAQPAIHRTTRRYIAGLIPEPAFPASPEIRHVLDVRKQAIDQRVTTLTTQALSENPPWLKDLGPKPTDPKARARWGTALKTVVAYRNAHEITSDHALGSTATTADQRLQRANAQVRISRLRGSGQVDPQSTLTAVPNRQPHMSMSL
ncbi:MAG: relaxase domain-containing protein [Propionibacteriaceae bacterium]|nr:relaxase domain-containing protein [Propionibacteriaceae bacterium]